jgi:hypothetical protein
MFRLFPPLYGPIGEFGEYPTNFLECGILADDGRNGVSMGRADQHPDLMTKATCFGRPVEACGVLRTAVGPAREGGD